MAVRQLVKGVTGVMLGDLQPTFNLLLIPTPLTATLRRRRMLRRVPICLYNVIQLFTLITRSFTRKRSLTSLTRLTVRVRVTIVSTLLVGTLNPPLVRFAATRPRARVEMLGPSCRVI